MLIWGLLTLVIALMAAPFVLEAMRKPMDTEAQASAPGQFVETDLGALHTVWDGPEGGPLLVLVHGLTSPLYVWDAVVPGLTRLGFRVLRYDLAGRGFSDRVSSNDPDFHVAQLEALIASTRRRRVSLMGYSMGARIATEFAARHTNRVEHLCLVAPAGLVQSRSGLDQLARDLPGFGAWYARGLGVGRLRKGIAAQNEGTQIEGLNARLQAELDQRGVAPAILQDLRGALRDSDSAEHQRLARAALPMAAIFGAQDTVIPLDAADRLAAWNPEAAIITVEGAGHGLPHTHPDAVVAAFETLSDDFL